MDSCVYVYEMIKSFFYIYVYEMIKFYVCVCEMIQIFSFT